MIADRAFTDRVMERLALVEQNRRRDSWLRCVLPLAIILAIGGSWAISFFDAALAIHLSIQVIAICNLVGLQLQHLTVALLGPFAPLPLIVSLLLLLSALGWVRTHQPDPTPAGWAGNRDALFDKLSSAPEREIHL